MTSPRNTSLIRVVAPEVLDDLQADDPRALRCRRDLRRLNRAMGNAQILASTLMGNGTGPAISSIAELGTGDGWLLSQTALRLPPANGQVTLVDRQGPPAAESVRT